MFSLLKMTIVVDMVVIFRLIIKGETHLLTSFRKHYVNK